MHQVETERLLLRRWQPGDLEELAGVFQKPQVWWYPFKRGWTAAETEAFLTRQLDEWDTRGWSMWAAVAKADAALIGYVGLSVPDFLPEVMPAVEVGWRIDPDYWGRGLATEGGRAALDCGFSELGLDEIVSICELDNVASLRVMQRLGMAQDHETHHPRLGVPLHVLRIDREGWRSSAGP